MTGLVGYTGSLKTIIDGKAPLTSPAFTGTPTIGGTPVAKTTDIAALVNAAPGTLDTLGELAAALTADEGTAATLATLVGTKAPLASPAFTGTPTIDGVAIAKITDIGTGSGSGSAPTSASTALAKFYAATATRATAPVIVVTYGDSYFNYASIQPKLHAKLQQEWAVAGATAVGWTNDLTTARTSRGAGVQLVNAAVDGQTSASMTDAGRSASIAALKPALYIIMIGANDANPAVGVTPAQHKTNILNEIAYQKANNPAPFAFVLVHAFPRQDGPVVPPYGPWSAYGQVEQDIAAADPGFVVAVDLAPAFAAVGVPGADPYTLMNADLLHPVSAGGQFIVDLLWDAIRPRLALGANTSATPYKTLQIMAAPVLSGSTAVGATLTVTNGSWSATPDAFTYMWFQDSLRLYDSSGPTRVTQSSDAGHTISAGVYATKTGWGPSWAAANAVTIAGSVAATTPGAPTGLAAVAGSGQVALSWTAPASTGGAAVSDYIVQFSTDGTTFTTFADGTSSATTATVTGLANGTTYTFRVAAVNSAGTGAYSSTTTGTPTAAVSVPGAPTGLAATSGDASAALSWTAPASNGGAAISDYRVQYSTDGTTFTTFARTASATTTQTVTGLTNGTAYTFRVAAINTAGTGANSGTATATPAAAVVTSSDVGGPLTTLRGTPAYGAGKFGQALTSGVLSGAGVSPAASTGKTVEFWAKVPVAATATLVALKPSINGSGWLGFTNGKFHADAPGGALNGDAAINDNVWHHFAVVINSSSSVQLYLDGVADGFAISASAPGFEVGAVAIGGFGNSTGFDVASAGVVLDEVRISNVARYTGTFTPPTAPFTADANTLALYHLEGS